jgi:hypothetical protein
MQLSLRRRLRFLHESVQHDDAPPNQGTVENSANTFLGLCANLKKSLAQCARVRHTQIRADAKHALSNMHITRLALVPREPRLMDDRLKCANLQLRIDHAIAIAIAFGSRSYQSLARWTRTLA